MAHFLQEYFGGDCEVVILPSGTAVRIKNTPVPEPEKDQDRKSTLSGAKRKRKQSELESQQQLQHPVTPVKMPPPYEVFPPGKKSPWYLCLSEITYYGKNSSNGRHSSFHVWMA